MEMLGFFVCFREDFLGDRIEFDGLTLFLIFIKKTFPSLKKSTAEQNKKKAEEVHCCIP